MFTLISEVTTAKNTLQEARAKAFQASQEASVNTDETQTEELTARAANANADVEAAQEALDNLQSRVDGAEQNLYEAQQLLKEETYEQWLGST